MRPSDGGDVLRVTLTGLNEPAVEAEAVLLDLDAALTSLAEIDARKAEIVQLQYFGGLSFQELEEVTGLSSSTLDRELRFSRAWLRDRLST
ncbi:MAG: ECF-type sigma factor [Steroidobacteraceae bacterium]